jgi:NitT/TauT family transport system substrate-binding protein
MHAEHAVKPLQPAAIARHLATWIGPRRQCRLKPTTIGRATEIAPLRGPVACNTERVSMTNSGQLSALIFSLAVLATLAPGAAWCEEDALRVAKSSPESFSFVPLDVGIAAGIFKNNGIDVQIVGFSGGTKMQQALAANSIDIAFGSGPQMILTAKGAPMMAVAEMAGAPINFAVIVPYDSPVHTLDDLKGKKIGVSGIPSLSSFMAEEIALTRGWGDKGITPVGIGGMNSGVIAALRAHLVDAVTFDLRVGLQLEQVKQARVLAPCSDYVTHFITHAIFARDNIINNKPDVLRRFLKGWFESLKFMANNKTTSVDVASKVTNASADLESLEYDREVPKFFSPDGRFKPDDLAAVSKALVLLQQTNHAPDMSKLYTEAFLPQ